MFKTNSSINILAGPLRRSGAGPPGSAAAQGPGRAAGRPPARLPAPGRRHRHPRPRSAHPRRGGGGACCRRRRTQPPCASPRAGRGLRAVARCRRRSPCWRRGGRRQQGGGGWRGARSGGWRWRRQGAARQGAQVFIAACERPGHSRGQVLSRNDVDGGWTLQTSYYHN